LKFGCLISGVYSTQLNLMGTLLLYHNYFLIPISGLDLLLVINLQLILILILM